MTNSRTVAYSCGLLLLLGVASAVAPSASAHGIPAPAPLFTRILTDDGSGGQDYGGCPHVDPVPCPADKGAVDLLGLDVREAYRNGTAHIALRVLFQAREPTHADRSITIALTGANATAVTLTGDGTMWASPSCTGPVTVMDAPGGDGTPKAVDCWLPASTLNATAGSTVTDVVVQSGVGADKGDYMPGGWFATNDQMVVAAPIIPEEPGEAPVTYTEEMGTPGTYAVQGPAVLLNVTIQTAAKVEGGNVVATLRVANLAPGLAQFVNITAFAPAGVSAAVDPAAVNLLANASQDVTLRVPGRSVTSIVIVAFASDLGALATLAVPIPALVVDDPCAASHTHGNTTEHGHDAPAVTCPTTSTTTDGQDAPDAGAVLAALALVGVALVRRRRA